MRVGPKVNGKDGIERRGSRQRSPALSAAVFGNGDCPVCVSGSALPISRFGAARLALPQIAVAILVILPGPLRPGTPRMVSIT